MATISRCDSENCSHNHEGQCQLDSITLDDCYECEQYLDGENI